VGLTSSLHHITISYLSFVCLFVFSFLSTDSTDHWF